MTWPGYGDLMEKALNIDRSTATGVRFNRAYNQLPLCNSTRVSVMAGLCPDRIQVYDLDRHFRDVVPDVIILPKTSCSTAGLRPWRERFATTTCRQVLGPMGLTIRRRGNGRRI
ncbi:MAG: hypothetical protein M2R45_02250 [Verrucomicrobia subdivision 3 bacterium]|nr:hypothetical protein [Limisphaerales bacterium]MCS1413964.1 hypothetical protein [Limisphaerales bacterium]